MFNLEKYDNKIENEKIILSDELKNDVIFVKYKVNENDVIKIQDNQAVILFEKGKILDIKDNIGKYIIKNTNKIINEKWQKLTIRNSENEELCVIFLTLSPLTNNKYIFNKPIKYIDWENNKRTKKYIKLDGRYDFKIENPQIFLSKVIGLRTHFTKQELIEKVRIYILSSIEEGINEICTEYKLDIDTLVKNSKELEIDLQNNKYDEKLLEYGIKLTYFDIENVQTMKRKFNFF